MARGQFLSVMGLYKYDNTLFDKMVLPGAVNRNVLIENICYECAEFELLYPSAPVMKNIIGSWSNKRLYTWEQMANVLYEKYDPFINIKRDEVRTIKQTRDLESTNTGDNTTLTNAYDDGTGTERDRINSNFTNTDTGTIVTEENFHVEGDSAITDAQDVARKEIKLRADYDMYNMIIEEFKQRFCLTVY